MGYKWPVIVAQTISLQCTQEAFQIFRASKLSPGPLLSPLPLLFEKAPIFLSTFCPLFLIIIDDISVFFHDQRDNATRLLHRALRVDLRQVGFPVKESKFLPVTKVEHNAINFMGCTRDLETSSIVLAIDKIPKLLAFWQLM